jgi:hypothetical protein
MSVPQPRAAFACSATSLDDITVFLGPLSPEEYELRRRIRACRNAASFAVTKTDCPNALTLLWMVCEVATRWVYAPAGLDTLTDVATFLRRLLILAHHAEELERVP